MKNDLCPLHRSDKDFIVEPTYAISFVALRLTKYIFPWQYLLNWEADSVSMRLSKDSNDIIGSVA